MYLIFSRYVNFVKDPSILEHYELLTALQYISGGSTGNMYTWNWVRANYRQLVDRWAKHKHNTHLY